MKFSWNEINKHITEDFDLLIVFASFEKRSLSLAKNLPRGKIKKALIFYLSNYKEYLTENLPCLKDTLKEKNISNETIELFHDKPLDSFDCIVKCLDEHFKDASVQNIIIDITTFTHEILLFILMLFKQKYTKTNVTFAYSNAKDYEWLSKGIGAIRSVIGYPGDLLPTRQTHLVIIVGYEYDRALSIISEIEPTSLSLGFGKSESSTTDVQSKKHIEAQKHFEEVVRDSKSFVSRNRVTEFNISCNSPEQAIMDIQSHLEQNNNATEGKNILMFAMNNKLSTLGVGLFALEHQDIRLCYAPALVYNYKNYSIPGEECYLFKLPGKL